MVFLSYLSSLPGYMMGSKGPLGFGSRSTAAEVASTFKDEIKDRVFVVTGCNCGIGKETARVLAASGGTVYMACRDESKMKKARAEILRQHADAKVECMVCDLASLRSVESFAEEFLALNVPLHCLINNAGVMRNPPTLTKDGAEMQFGTNVLGHYHLTNLLLPVLKESGKPDQPSRIVILSSTAHMAPYPGGIRFGNMGLEGYDRQKAYGQSKLGNMLHARGLYQRLRGSNVFVACCHPGVILTELGRNLPKFVQKIAHVGFPVLKSIPQGAATTLALATGPTSKLLAGGYHADCSPDLCSPYGRDDELTEKFMSMMEKMVNDPAQTNFENPAVAG